MIKPREIRWVGLAADIEKTRNSCRVLVRKPKGTRTFTRPRSRFEDKIKTDLKASRWEGTGWIHLAQDRDQFCNSQLI
jgi:hypothetical protein